MNFVKTAAAVALSTAALIGGATPAMADTLVPPYPTVTAWHDVNVRTCSSTSKSCPVSYQILAGNSSLAYCWVYGQTITDFGITNDVWIQVDRKPGAKFFASAVYFAGDKYANLPVKANCTD